MRTFETKRFRVQITDQTAWIESNEEGDNWIFRKQCSLPLSLEALHERDDASILPAAVQHFESIHNGDKSLREALTGVTAKVPPPIALPAKPSFKSNPVGRIYPTQKTIRMPLRPPLAAQ